VTFEKDEEVANRVGKRVLYIEVKKALKGQPVRRMGKGKKAYS